MAIAESLSILISSRAPVEEVLKDIKSDSSRTSEDAGLKLCAQARRFGLSMRDYLKLKIDTTKGEMAQNFVSGDSCLDGYEASLVYLNLPIRNDMKNGIVLEAAAETFQTFAGTRAIFPEVIDDVLQFKFRQDQFENVADLLANTRTTTGPELITTVVNDTQAENQSAATIAELANIPVRSVRSTQNSVKFFKLGSGIRFSFEFARRAQLDILSPYMIRVERELERSKVAHATDLLINGDAVHAAAAVVNQSTLDSAATVGAISYEGFLKWVVTRAQNGVPIDTVVGNWDAFFQWLRMFAVPNVGTGVKTAAEALASGSVNIATSLPVFKNPVSFVLSSTAPANQLIGFSKGDTVEELVEAGSNIQQSEDAIRNQSTIVVRTQNVGYRLVFGDTRQILNFGA